MRNISLLEATISCSGSPYGPGALDALAALPRMQGLPEVVATLHVQPEICAVAKDAR
jgi:hypothetical protein